MRAVIDTNILIDYLAGGLDAGDELTRHAGASISAITWMEVLVGAADEPETERLRWFLSGFQRIPIDDAVAELAVEIRRKNRMRLPDAIIWASARSIGGLLVTRNTKDFPPEDPGVRVPYALPGGDNQ